MSSAKMIGASALGSSTRAPLRSFADRLVDSDTRRRTPVLFLLRDVNLVSAQIYSKAVHLLLHGNIGELADTTCVIFTKHRDESAVAGNVDAPQSGVIGDHVSAIRQRQ